MVQSPQYLKKTVYTLFALNTPIVIPGNDQNQTKTGYKFIVTN